MKKFISIALLLAMCLSLFAGCAPAQPDNTQPATAAPLTSAKDYLRSMYKETDKTKTLRDYDVVAVVTVGTTTFNIEWTVEVTAGDKAAVAVGETKDNKTTIKVVNAKPAEEVKYVLKGTIKDADGKTEEVKFEHNIPAVKVDPAGPVLVEKPEAGKAYKFFVFQGNLEKNLYFTGEMSGKYMATTENPAEAVDMFAEAGKEGIYLYFNKDGKKQYVEVYEYEQDGKQKSGIRLSDKPVNEYVYNAECKNLVTKLANGEYYIGAYKEFNTLSASLTKYIKPDNAGISQFPAGLCTVKSGSAETATNPVPGTDYKMRLVQGKLEKTLYLTGNMAGFYYETTEDAKAAATVFVEKADKGVYIGFKTADGKKQYITVNNRETEKCSTVFTDKAETVFSYNKELTAWVCTITNGTFYLGTYGDHNTISASAIKYISGDNASKIGVSQFVVDLVPAK